MDYDDLGSVTADFVTAVVLRPARVRDQPDHQQRRHHDQKPLKTTSHTTLLPGWTGGCHTAAEIARTTTESALSITSNGQTQRR